MLNRNVAPKIYSPIEFEYNLPDCHQVRFANGIQLYYYTDSIQPIVQLELVFKAGLWYESQAAQASATGALLKNGTSSKTAFQINEWIEQYGASVKVSVGVDLASITISCLTKHLSKMLPLVYELLTDAQYPQEELAIYQQNAKQRLSVNLLKTDFTANRKIDEFLFGFKHPYGRYVNASDYDNLHPDLLKSFLKKYYQSANCTLFMAGCFSEEDIQLIQEVFGMNAWNDATPVQASSISMESEAQHKHRIPHDEKSVQGSIRLASLFPTKHHPDFYPMIVLNTVFGGYFGSRLMSNIREEKGYTYGIHSYMYNHMQQSAYLITTEAGKDVCEAAIEEIYREMQLLRDEIIPEEELELVKNYLLGTILGDLDGSFQIMQRWKNLILNGFTKSRFEQNIEIYKTITSTKLAELANTYYKPELFYDVIVA